MEVIMNVENVCPVCGAVKSDLSLSEYDCDKCGFSNAYVHLFASKQGHDLWQKKVDAAKKIWDKKKRAEFAAANPLYVGSSLIAFLDAGQKNIYILHGNGMMQTENNAVGINANELNVVITYADGTVKVLGNENTFGQKKAGSWTDMVYATMGANCTYGIKRDGSVLYAGVPVSQTMTSWKDVSKMDFGPDYAVGLRKDGTVVVSGGAPETISSGTAKWTNVTDVAVSRDSVAGLRQDGTVLYAGADADPKKDAAKWKKMIAIAADNTFIYGLDEDGKVSVAGSCKRILDKGRSGAASWEKVIALSANQSGIGAITEDGKLLVAGGITGDLQKIIEKWNSNVEPVVSY